jgi:hypothetical protein
MRKEFDDYVAGLEGVKSTFHKSQNTFKRSDGTMFCKTELAPRSSIFVVTFTDMAHSTSKDLPACAQPDGSDRVRIRVISRGRLEMVMKMAKERLG